MEKGWKPNVEITPACPRCGSTNTKFCYYNNYSLTQPRYFCKGCRRYWTKGGSLRNVPVGGGCRKSRRGRHVITPRGFTNHSGGGGSTEALAGHHSCSTSTSTHGPNIDLALVYANYLNPNSSELKLRYKLLEVGPNVVDPTFQFSNIETMHNNIISTTDKSSSEGNPFYQFSEDHHFTGIDYMNNNYILPPLPGEEIVTGSATGIVWPSSSDLINYSGHNSVHTTHDESNIGVLFPHEPHVSNQQLDHDSDLFDIPNYGVFPGLEK